MCSIPFVQAERFSTGNQSTDLLGPEISTVMSAWQPKSMARLWLKIAVEKGISRYLCWVGFKSPEIKMSEICHRT